MRKLHQAGERSLIAVLVLLCGGLPCFASNRPEATSGVDRPLHIYKASIPLGAEVFSYSNNDDHRVFYVMASAQNLEFEGDALWAEGERHVLKTPQGEPVRSYPQTVSFRVSVSQRDGFLNLDEPLPVEWDEGSFDQLITGLKFEVRIFHALETRVIHPAEVRQIGVPPDVPSDERVYQVTFNLGDVPISDRLVMHVLTDDGERLAKFNVDLY